MSGDIRFVDNIAWSALEFSDEQVADALEDGAREEVLPRAEELVPKRTGDLAGSGFVRAVGANEVHKAAAVGFNSVYARWVEEHLWFRHPFGGQAKYLESSLDEKGFDAIKRAVERLLSS